MNRYSWHTPGEKTDGGWYKCDAVIIFPGNKVGFKSYPFFKPNRKGGHKHNHVYNASQRAVFRRSIMDNQIPEGYTVKKVTWKDVASEIADIFILAAIMGIGFLGLWQFLWG